MKSRYQYNDRTSLPIIGPSCRRPEPRVSSRGGHVVSSQQVQAQHRAAQCQLGVFRHRASDRAGLVAARAVLAGDGTNAREARARSSTPARAANACGHCHCRGRDST
ncbi:hypothetical protein XFF6992_220132 [Xanthomonas citri pv. fuscans]|nr:hypothetical protein XFF6992_220132 [Xanthomonas citri pv. fuscans]SOO31889.1 hypothetical protein XFF6994_1580007 [Xanthomonas citri pv. fuscans]